MNEGDNDDYGSLDSRREVECLNRVVVECLWMLKGIIVGFSWMVN